jgi:glyoxylase-like metal-dependent hydrolase (beta-lactamase superfamily II)
VVTRLFEVAVRLRRGVRCSVARQWYAAWADTLRTRCHRTLWAPLMALALGPCAISAQVTGAAGVWNGGAADEPVLRIRRHAPGFWIIRQGKRSNAEAPFMYLIAGRDSALLLDTGAKPTDGRAVPLVRVVDSLLATLDAHRVWPVLVLHSHGHGDHRALDTALTARPQTHVIPADTAALVAQLGLTAWPDAPAVSIELGRRTVLVLPTPGHQAAHIMLYDARTRVLLSGDMLYPGLLTVRDLPAFRASVARLERFAAAHPIRLVLGAHVEMSREPRRMYPLGSVAQPAEHALALAPTSVHRLAVATRNAGDFIADVPGDDFILGRVQPASTDLASTHGMLLFGRERVFLSHLPMSRAPHDYQLVFEAQLPEDVLRQYRSDVAAHPNEPYTLEPASQWVLPRTIRTDSVFRAHVYRGHFERGGVRIASDVAVTVRQVVMFRKLEPTDIPQPGAWFTVGSAAEQFLIHRIAGRGDVDEVLTLCPGARLVPDGTAIVLAPDGEKRVGSRTPLGAICRVVYAERGDLAP